MSVLNARSVHACIMLELPSLLGLSFPPLSSQSHKMADEGGRTTNANAKSLECFFFFTRHHCSVGLLKDRGIGRKEGGRMPSLIKSRCVGGGDLNRDELTLEEL